MIQGIGSTSLRKQDVTSQKTPATGFKKIVFAHKATAGATGLDLNSLSLPSEMPGFTNPNVQELQAANLLFYRKNFTLISSIRGVLIDYMSYEVMSNMSVLFSDDFGTALEGEIFVGTIDHSVSSGNMVVDAQQIGASGTLTAGTTDFNVGTPFTVNAYPNRQFGEVMVFLDGAIQYRNTNNSSVTLDGNYYEVDAGDGTGIIIRFNVTDPSNDRDVIVAGVGVVAERPSGSMMAVIESLAGKIDSMSSVVSDLSGLTEYQIVGANPTYVDLKTFGDRVIALESNRARIDLTNTFLVFQNIPGRTDGTTPGTGNIGETLTATRSTTYTLPSPVVNTLYDVPSLSLTLTPGVWALSFSGGAARAAGSTNNFVATATIRDGSNNVISCVESTSNAITTANAVSLVALSGFVATNTSLTVKLSAGIFQTGGSPPTGISGDIVLNAGGVAAVISTITFRAIRIA